MTAPASAAWSSSPSSAELEAGAPDPAGTRHVRATRRFVAFAREVDGLLLAGRTAEGPSLALVPRERPGAIIRRQDEITRGDLCSVRFESTAVERDEWLGRPGGAAAAWSATMPSCQVRHAAYLVGLAQGSFDGALRYAKERRQFGQPIARLQSVGFRLAALATRIEAARHLTHFAAWRIDQGEDSRLTAVQALPARPCRPPPPPRRRPEQPALRRPAHRGPGRRYDWVYVLAAAERRSEDPLLLHYSGGAVEPEWLRVSDFWPETPAHFGELAALRLPDNPAIHLFAMTLLPRVLPRTA